MTFIECIDKVVKENFIGIDNTCNGKCIKCGECCGIVLPLDQEDANKIQDYVIENKIFPQRHIRVMTNKLQCPYYTGDKNKGCSIYEARPKICRYYQCNKKFMPINELENMKNTIPVDMWAFAEAVEKEMIKNGINKQAREKTKKSV